MAKLNKNEVIRMRIKRIEKEIRDTPYHKGTEHHIGRLRAQLSKLKEEVESTSRKKGGTSKGYAIKKQGDATVCLVGSPSVGKSTLLNKLTNAKSKVAPYEFTTLTVIPGMMEYHDAKIQILDVPGLIEGSEEGRGKGKEVLSVIRGSDLLIIMCDVNKLANFERVINSLEKNGIRINKIPPQVTIEKKLKGGIKIISSHKQDISKQTITDVAKEFRLINAEITLKEKLTLDQLIDVFSFNRVYVPAIFVINKIDLTHQIDIKNIFKNETYIDICLISAERGEGLADLKKAIWKNLKLSRVYLVKSGEKPNQDNPIVLKAESTLYDVLLKISSEFADNKKGAKIWGPGAKFPGQAVSLFTKIQEGMLIRFI